MSLSTWAANGTCLAFTLIYVVGFYVFNTPGSRNEPPVMQARMKAVTLASIVCYFVVVLVTQETKLSSTMLGLQLWPSLSWFSPVLLTMMLFLGPLAVMWFDGELPFQKNFSVHDLTSLMALRNFVVAPMTEEFVFRACIIAILHEAGYSIKHLIYVSPLYFGIAHLHHAWGNYKQWGGTARALRNALLSSTFQFAYTTVFGWYASYLFVRTGNVWSPVLCHSFCNYMGFPELNNINHRPLLHRIVIYTCFPAGVYLFIRNLNKLTDPVGGSIYWD